MTSSQPPAHLLAGSYCSWLLIDRGSWLQEHITLPSIFRTEAITAPANDYCEMSCEDVYNEYKDNGYPEWACLNYRYYCLKDCRGY